ncbi:MAG: secretion protein HlyD [Planctomyces sp.]|nr:secretion protein HlyD [Planctomyces sp.]
MTTRSALSRLFRWGRWILSLALLAGLAVTHTRWLPPLEQSVRRIIQSARGTPPTAPSAAGSHEDHDHDHGDKGAEILELSARARGNLGLNSEFLQPPARETYRRSVTIPGLVVDRPGRTRVEVSTPMAGVITHVHAVRGESVPPGADLFHLRITAEEFVDSQTDLLKTLGALDVEEREITRLSQLSETGAISQRTLLERQYERDKLQAILSAQREALRLHGLSDEQVEAVVRDRRPLSELVIVAVSPDEHDPDEPHLESIRPAAHEELDPSDQRLVLQDVRIRKGQTVAAGQTLAVLADYSELYIEGQAFEHDIPALLGTLERGWPITAAWSRPGQPAVVVGGLELAYFGSEIDVDSRTMPFYVRLPNRIVRRTPSPNGFEYLDWAYRPGERLQLQVPVEEWPDQLVVPVQAVARDGADAWVFRYRQRTFERVGVRLLHRDQVSAVIADDGALRPNDRIALKSAHQLLMAFKNQSGGGIDPHAGHQH